jgi:hypothetical protein
LAPEKLISRRSIGSYGDHRFGNPLQQRSAADTLVVRVRHQNQGPA